MVGGEGGNFHLRTQVLYYSGFVTYQFQFHVSLTYLMVFRPPPTFQLLHCLSQNIFNMTTGRKRFYPSTPTPPLLYVSVKWNGIPPILHKFICILFYYDVIDSNCILQTQLTLKDRKEGSEERVKFVFYFKPISFQSLPLTFTCLGNLLPLRVKYVA